MYAIGSMLRLWVPGVASFVKYSRMARRILICVNERALRLQHSMQVQIGSYKRRIGISARGASVRPGLRQ